MATYEIQDGGGPAAHGYDPDEMSTGERTGAAKLKWVVIVDQSLSPGLPWAGCSILSAGSAQLAAIRRQAIDRQLLAADMPAAAQATRVYDDYLRELAKTHPDDLAVLAVSLIGPRNQVAKLVRHLELLP